MMAPMRPCDYLAEGQTTCLVGMHETHPKGEEHFLQYR